MRILPVPERDVAEPLFDVARAVVGWLHDVLGRSFVAPEGRALDLQQSLGLEQWRLREHDVIPGPQRSAWKQETIAVSLQGHCDGLPTPQTIRFIVLEDTLQGDLRFVIRDPVMGVARDQHLANPIMQ
jgi:hypothetical protein